MLNIPFVLPVLFVVLLCKAIRLPWSQLCLGWLVVKLRFLFLLAHKIFSVTLNDEPWMHYRMYRSEQQKPLLAPVLMVWEQCLVWGTTKLFIILGRQSFPLQCGHSNQRMLEPFVSCFMTVKMKNAKIIKSVVPMYLEYMSNFFILCFLYYCRGPCIQCIDGGEETLKSVLTI